MHGEGSLTTIGIARAGAIAISASTFVFLFLHDSWRTDNLFLVPDLVLCAALMIAAFLPAPRALPALTAAYGFTAGVLGCSVAEYAVRGELGWASLVGALAAATMAIVLGQPWLRSRA